MSDSEREMRCAGIETADPRDAAHARRPPPDRPAAPGQGRGLERGRGRAGAGRAALEFSLSSGFFLYMY